MTVSNQNNRTSVVGTGAEQEIPFTFPITSTSDITVYKRLITTGEETKLDETEDYTVVIDGTSGGTVTTVTPFFASTYQIHIIRDTPMTQTLDLVQGGSFNAENIETALDKSVRLIIENSNSLDRTLRFPETDAASIIEELPKASTRAGKFLYFGADGNPSVAENITTGETTITPFGKDLIDDISASAALTTLGFSPYGKTLIDDTTAALARETLGLHTDDNVEFAKVTSTNIITKGPWHDITAYGAGTGESAATNATAIQAALDAVESAGSGAILVPAGEFDYDTTLTMASYVGIIGMGPGASILNFTAVDGSNAIEGNGTGDDLSTGVPKIFCWMREVAVKGNASSGHGIVFDIAKYITLFNVYSYSHGGDCYHIGSPPVAAGFSTTMGRVSMINCHSSGGTNSVYAAGGNIYIGGQCGFNDASAIGIILEDMRISYLNGISGGSGSGTATHGIEIRSSASNESGDYDMYSIHLNDIHWEQLESGDYFVNVAMGGTTELIGLSITDCEYSLRAAHGIKLDGVVKNVYIDRNHIISRRTTDSAIGVTIGSECENIYVTERNYWPYNLNINNNASAGELHCSEEHIRVTSSNSTSGTGEDDIAATTIEASYLETHGGLKIKAAGTKTGGASNSTIKLHFGSSSWEIHAAATNTNDWRIEAEIINTATNAQKISWICWDGATVLQGYETASEDTTAAVILKITGECADGGDAILLQFWTVDRF